MKLLPLAPVHVPPAAPFALMLMFVSVSVNEALVSAEALLLLKVSVTVEVPPD